MTHSEAVDEIIRAAGGKSNVTNAWHCMTRLRFALKSEKDVDLDALSAIDPVIGAQFSNGQLQVIIGTDVEDYYEPLMDQLGLNRQASIDENLDGEEPKKNLVTRFMDVVSGTFGPIVPAIAGAGMMKGLLSGLAAIGTISNTTDTYMVLDMLASGVFTFLPFFVAVSAAKIFKTNQFVALALAAAMQYPTMTNAAAAGEITQFMLFGIVPVPVFSYAGNVIPILFTVLMLSYVWKFVDKHLPKVMRTVFTPLISLFVTGIIAFAIIGPIGIYVGRALAAGVSALFSFSPVLAGFIMGATRPILVFCGLHHAMTPVALQNFASQGWDMLMPTMFMANLAMSGATAAVYFKAKDEREKSVIVGAVISGFLGITEPALFGVLSKYRKAFVSACLGAGIASAVICAFGVRIYGYITSSIFSLVAYIGPYFPFAIMGLVIAVASSFAISTVIMMCGKQRVQ